MDTPSVEAPLTRDRILVTAEGVIRRFGPDKATLVEVARALEEDSSVSEGRTTEGLRGVTQALAYVEEHEERTWEPERFTTIRRS